MYGYFRISRVYCISFSGAIIDGTKDLCEECLKKFTDSYLLKNFDVMVCDSCRYLFVYDFV